VLPNPKEFSIEKLCVERLSNLGLGGDYATEFHRLTELILTRVFQNNLRKFQIELEINEGTKRVDIVCRNSATDGFFRRLDSHYHIPSPNIFIECKNYRSEIANPEVDSISRQAPWRSPLRRSIISAAGLTSPTPKASAPTPSLPEHENQSGCVYRLTGTKISCCVREMTRGFRLMVLRLGPA
jgi:hypothetical protein